MKKMKINRKYLTAVLFFLLSAVLIFSCLQTWKELKRRHEDIDTFAELEKMVEIRNTDEIKISDKTEKTNDTAEPVELKAQETAHEPDPVKEPDETKKTEQRDSGIAPETAPSLEIPKESAPAIRHDIPLLMSKNPDCFGWISIDGTAVNYPVMHTPELPQKYLRMDFYMRKSSSGVPFLDFRCVQDSGNLIIYGHNTSNGTMFGSLKKYLKKGYISAHPSITLETADGTHEFRIFAAVPVDKQDPWYSFIFSDNEDEFNAAVSRIVQKASLTYGQTPVFGDRLLTLSTCYKNTEYNRLIIIAKEVM